MSGHPYDSLIMNVHCIQSVLFRLIRDLTQQDGWKTQDDRMTKKCQVTMGMHSLAQHLFFIVLSLPAVLLRKVSINVICTLNSCKNGESNCEQCHTSQVKPTDGLWHYVNKGTHPNFCRRPDYQKRIRLISNVSECYQFVENYMIDRVILKNTQSHSLKFYIE